MNASQASQAAASLSELQRIYHFTEDDLIANRQGELSDAQRNRLRNGLFRQLFAAPVVGGVVVALIFILIGTDGQNAAVWTIPLLVLAGVMWSTFRALIGLMRINDGQVTEITGAAMLSDHASTEPATAETQGGGCAGMIIGALLTMLLTALVQSLSRSYYLSIGSSEFRISRAAYQAFMTGAIYKIYTPGNTRQIIAVESLTR